ncbi:hypothetical protein [Winogradskyella flava]|uniref:hypothetical protein n=1 Tax=Winogradskyella flava TaxID=1884876 RepID=UPI00248FD2E7|nr:hypothetical protein [Winogradskyella flava]
MQQQLVKLVSRLKIISLYGLGQSISPLGKLIFSYLIIKYQSIELWGSFTQIAIWIYLILVFLSFGNNDFLLKKFSLQPSNIFQTWLTHLLSRAILLLPCALIIIFSPLFKENLYTCILWLFLLFIVQAYNVIILYFKDFKLNLIGELFYSSTLIFGVITFNNSIDLDSIITIMLLATGVKAILYITYYFKRTLQTKIDIDLSVLGKSLPFFIPAILGTIRFKIDTYFANTFFSISDLGKYEIFISLLVFGQTIVTFFINPFLKNFFRLKTNIVNKIKKQFIVLGVFYGVLFTTVTYLVITHIYSLDFSMFNYLTAFVFIVPIFVHILLINQMYKNNLQKDVSIFAFTIVLLQITFGLVMQENYGVDEAFYLKAFSQVLITIILWFWLNKHIKVKNIA